MNFIGLKYITILCFFTVVSHAQNSLSLTGSTAGFSVGQSTVAWNDAHASANNQAGMLGTENLSFQVSAGMQWGFLPVFSVSGSKRINRSNAFGMSIKHIGDSDLNNQIIGISYARKILKNWDIGIQADLLTYQTRSFGSRYLATMELSSMMQATEKLRVGFHIFNPFGLALTESRDIPAIFRLGALYSLSEKVSMMAEVEQDLVLGYNLKAGLDYELVDKLHLRAGFTTGGNQLHFGLSYGFGNYTIHGASSLHPQLGFTPAGEISFQN